MLFRRREKEDFKQRMRVALWPRRTWWRSIKYLVLRVLRLTASPHAIAMGVAAGVFASFTPFLGFHFMIAFAICSLTRGSYVAGATGTLFGNPLTFLPIWTAVLAAGRFVLDMAGIPHLANHLDFSHLTFDMILNSFWTVWPLIKTMTVGSFIVGVPVASVCYLIVRKMAAIYQRSRLKMLPDRARANWADRLDRQLKTEYEASLAESAQKDDGKSVETLKSKAVT